MRAISLFMALSLAECGFAQGVTVSGGFGLSSGGGVSRIDGSGAIMGGGAGALVGGRQVGTGSLQVTLRSDGKPFAYSTSLTTSFRGSSTAGLSYFTRTVMDGAKHEYFGYEVLLEQQQPGTYRTTFGPIGFSTMEMASMGMPAKEWSPRTLTLPESKIVHDGDLISIELINDAARGEKLIEDITVGPFSQPFPKQVMPPGFAGAGPLLTSRIPTSRIPTVDGPARDFSAGDAEMRLTQPRFSINGEEQSFTQSQPGSTMLSGIPVNRNASGPLVWFYTPGKGRYILSLIARTELDFKKAGELRGGLIKFTVDGDSFTVECPVEIAGGGAPYNLYVLRDPLYEPTSQRQKGQFAIGSVGVEELVMLKRQ